MKDPLDKKYILPCVNVFCGDLFSDNQEAYAGFMLSDSPTFNIEAEHVRYDLTAPAFSNIPFLFDMEEREIVILDFNNRKQHGVTVRAEIDNMKKLISAISDKNTITYQDLSELLSRKIDDTTMVLDNSLSNVFS